MLKHNLPICVLLWCLWQVAGYARADSPPPQPAAETATLYNPATVNQLYDKTAFNLLVDYYTEIPGRPYGTGITAENLRNSLRMCRPGYVIYYAKGHSGTTAFKSRLGTEHPMLGGDPLKVVRQVTRECGVKLILYYSGLIDGAAAERHPEWRPAGGDGKRQTKTVKEIPYRMAPLCASSRYFDDWVAPHLEEIIGRYDPDGIWIDGCWEWFTCYCDDCRKAATAQFGDGNAVGKPEFQAWARDHFRRRFTALVRRLKPACLVSFGNTTPVVSYGFTNYMDYQSGDWFSPSNHRYAQSLAMRRYTTLGIPYEAMTCDTAYALGLGTRSLPKTLDRMLQEGASVLINGGKWIYWTYPMSHGALIPSQMRRAKTCRDWVAEREDLWLGTQSARWTAVVHNTTDIFGSPGVAKALVEAHHSPDIIHVAQLKEPIPYQLLVFDGVGGLNDRQVAMLERFVRGGGMLLSVGATAQNPGMPQLLGIEVVKDRALRDEGHVLLADGSPACLPCDWSQVRPTSAETWWKLYQSWGQHDGKVEQAGAPISYPITARLDEERPAEAGMPAVTARRLGRGLAVHVAGDPFPGFQTFGHPTVRAFTKNLLDRMQPQPLLATDAPSWIEISLRTRGDELLVHFLNGNPGFDISVVGSQDLFVDEIPEVGPYAASVRSAARPKAVFIEPGHKPLDFQWRDGRACFTVPRLKIHACVRLCILPDPLPSKT